MTKKHTTSGYGWDIEFTDKDLQQGVPDRPSPPVSPTATTLPPTYQPTLLLPRKRHTGWWALLLPVLALLIVGFLVASKDEGETPAASTSTTTPAVLCAPSVTVQVGESSDDVRCLEALLVRLGYDPGISDDGVFDADTMAAVKQFQKDSGRSPDGIVGPKTRQSLDTALAELLQN